MTGPIHMWLHTPLFHVLEWRTHILILPVQAVVTRISAHMPPWLTVWAVKWGLIAPSVTLLQLEFFSGNEASGSSGGSTRPARVVYIPYYGDA